MSVDVAAGEEEATWGAVFARANLLLAARAPTPWEFHHGNLWFA